MLPPSVYPHEDIVYKMRYVGIWEDDATIKDSKRGKGIDNKVRDTSNRSSNVKPKKEDKIESKPRPSKNKDEKEKFYGEIQSLLNKLTLEKFDDLSYKLACLIQTIDNPQTLVETVKRVHKKALSEPQFSSMYSDLCKILETMSPKFPDPEGKNPLSFKKLILNECHVAFEESIGVKPSDDSDLMEEYLKKRDRIIGNIVFISELFKKGFFPLKLIDRCINQIINGIEETLRLPRPIDPDKIAICESECEKLFNFISKCGKEFEQRSREHNKSHIVDGYMESLKDFASNKLITPRVRFLIRDVVDMRENNWTPRRSFDGPKKLDQIHEQSDSDMSSNISGQNRVTIPTSEYESRANKLEKERHLSEETSHEM